MPHRDFLKGRPSREIGLHASGSLQSPLAERGVKADTSMMSRFFRRVGVTVKRSPSSYASRTVRT
jgi:hypothetical protein